ncbi:MAG: peptidyl-prolyl cis-trans isomerase [Thermodesulfobacteriota bacterium]
MKRASLLGLVTVLVLWGSLAQAVWPFGERHLLVLNGAGHSKADFLQFWEQWKEEDSPVPDSPDFWIDWLLFYQEAEQMELGDAPAVQAKLFTFLKVRALMQLRQDEVTSRMAAVDEERLWQRYLQDEAPLYKIESVLIADQAAAGRFAELARAGRPFAEVVTDPSLGLAEPPKVISSDWLRKSKVPETYREDLAKAELGSVLGPLFWEPKKTYYLVRKVEQQAGSQEDFQRIRKDIEERLFKEEDGRLTRDLLVRLMKEYEVVTHDDRIEALPMNGGSQEQLSAVVVEMKGGRTVTGGELVQMVMRDLSMRMRPNAQGSFDMVHGDFNDAKRRVLMDYLGAELTVRAALDRHYEQKPPIKDVFDFYRQRRMILELKNRLFRTQVEVSDQEAQAFYQANQQLFTHPASLELAILSTRDEKLADFLRKELLSGKDFFEVANHVVAGGVNPTNVLVSDLDPAMVEALSGVAEGAQVGPVKIGEDTHFIKLIRRRESVVRPLDEVKHMITRKLHEERIQEKEEAFRQKLRAVSKIEVDDGQWQEVVRTLKAQEAARQQEKDKPAKGS